ncbi:mediator of RNA polymerase II transcription subunit 29-like [Teleopsis dalmanni]|uniref:mediator of RNA polymerase II transcription subunit 29-like n=1 Tax=Teleopsis dalmanni TaxID=139649 RepID=UPI0018CEAC6E|nr:mediator of RNA polymerase II transcription subunit 29-like [Teleopsis dalmanni]XP_037950258.1 mediator of RNA polymerase II transcription subunit 29-like [Teleopsis dalmanni]
MNMHTMQQQQMGVGPGPNAMMQVVSPAMQQQSPQVPNPVQQAQQQQQQQAEKTDNISKVKSLLGPLRESLFLTLRAAAFALQQNNLSDNLKRDAAPHPPRFDKHLEDFFVYCDQIELNLKTALLCMQQLSSAQNYLPGNVAAAPYMPDNPAVPMSYSTYLNTVRAHVESAKAIHDTLISAAQNISQAD